MVPSLPTRNGNVGITSFVAGAVRRSQPTYKEWKPTQCCQSSEPVGSGSQPTYKEWKQGLEKAGSPGSKLFPAYLQGMETTDRVLDEPDPVGSQPTYKEWKRLPALHRPGSAGSFPAYLQGMETTAFWILWVSIMAGFPAYLQGMETLTGVSAWKSPGSVPSLPTRNGNLYCQIAYVLRAYGSQPTYKEWKLPSDAVFSTWNRVPSLPTRNGNSICPAPSGTQRQVPSLPTRNGNSGQCLVNASVFPAFPAYLQGMETFISFRNSSISWGFPAYLQGMETTQNRRRKMWLKSCSQPTYKEWKRWYACGSEGFPL